jgi:hypothetical protein
MPRFFSGLALFITGEEVKDVGEAVWLACSALIEVFGGYHASSFSTLHQKNPILPFSQDRKRILQQEMDSIPDRAII